MSPREVFLLEIIGGFLFLVITEGCKYIVYEEVDMMELPITETAEPQPYLPSDITKSNISALYWKLSFRQAVPVFFLFAAFVAWIFGCSALAVTPLLYPLAVLLSYLANLKNIEYAYEIIHFGYATEGEITLCNTIFHEHDAASLGRIGWGTRRDVLSWFLSLLGRDKTVAVRWKFLTEDAVEYEGKAVYFYHTKYLLPSGYTGTVFYDPNEPRRNVWIGNDWRSFLICKMRD